MMVWILVLKPLGAIPILLLIYPFKWAVIRFMPDNKLKRLLLFRVGGSDYRG